MNRDMKTYILDNFEQAMQDGRIEVFYQPIVRVLTKEVCGWEALTRWIDEDGTIIPPNQFIGVLEEAQLIHKLDIYMIHKVCKYYRKRLENIGFLEPVSMNLSRLDFELCDIFAEVEAAVTENGLPRNMFDIEITESALVLDEKILGSEIKRFRSKGYQVWLDDFGSGYSSFNVIKDYDFDVLKIDMEFLRNFDTNPKVKKIIGTIVDMAKMLSIQTVAEGVETEEQFDFLRKIGCEKAQGYYFGKPLSYKDARESLIAKNLGLEKSSLRNYMDAISGINILSDYPTTTTAEVDNVSNITGASLSIIQYKDGLIRNILANRNFMKALFPLGLRSITEADDFFNTGRWREKKKALQIAAQARVDGMEHRLDFLHNGILFTMKIRHIATNTEEHVTAYIVTLQNHTSFIAEDPESIDKLLHFMCALYERIDMISLDGDIVQNIYLNSGRYRGKIDVADAIGSIEDYAKKNIYQNDQKKFLSFYSLDTFEGRFMEGNGRYMVDYFRTINDQGEYEWQSYTLIPTELNGKNMFISCVSDVDDAFIEVLNQTYVAQESDIVNRAAKKELKKVVEGSATIELKNEKTLDDINSYHILDNVLELTGAGIFWKDKQRRFLGANRKFLDYYGFDSIESILGKTDEEVGWHIDPDQYVNDEERVISKGEVIERSPGQCIIQGEVREIEATKRPLFQDGKIVGLIGFFVDVTDQKQNWRNMDDRLPQNEVSELSSEAAFHATLMKYEDQYWVRGLDFALVYVELKEMNVYRLSYGEAFEMKLLRRVVKELRKEIGENSVLIHKSENEFLVLHQYRQRIEIDELESRIRDALKCIHKIENIPIELSVQSGVGFYSETEDPTRMLKIVDSRKNGAIHTDF